MTNEDHALTGDAIEDAFLRNLGAEDATLSSQGREDSHDETEDLDAEDAELSDADEDEGDVEVTTDDADEATEDAPKVKTARTDLSDDDVISIKIDGEETTVSIQDLKRQYGQHRSNDVRSKELVAQRKQVEEQSLAHRVSLEAGYNRAAEKAKYWDGIDWAAAFKELETPAFNSLRAAAQDAFNELAYFEDGLKSDMEAAKVRTEQEVQSRIQSTIVELAHPDTGIKGFGNELIQELGTYAQEMGVPSERLTDLFHAPILRILHDAVQYRKAQKATKATSPVVKTANKIVKNTVNADTSRRASKPSTSSALQKLARSGSLDDAESAFLASFGSRDRD